MRILPSADFVKTSGSVTNRPPSFGQHLSTGISDRSTSSPYFATSWHGGVPETVFGNIFKRGKNFFAAENMSEKLFGGDISAICAISPPDSASDFAPIARDILRSLPNRFAATQNALFPPSTTFSNNSALPPPGFLDSASTIFGISISGDTGSLTRRSSPSESSSSMNSRMSLKALFTAPTP